MNEITQGGRVKAWDCLPLCHQELRVLWSCASTGRAAGALLVPLRPNRSDEVRGARTPERRRYDTRRDPPWVEKQNSRDTYFRNSQLPGNFSNQKERVIFE